MNTSLEFDLRDRALMLQKAREFFSNKGVLEVDTPILSKTAPIDLHIDIAKVLSNGTTGYLHSSPEYAMKRLLAKGSGDIYQMSHVFRAGEIGHLHNPEFTMVEWYRCGFSFAQMEDETADFIRLFVGNLPSTRLSYREAFSTHTGIDIGKTPNYELAKYAVQFSPASDPEEWDRDTLLQFIMSFAIEPHFGNNTLTILNQFPASQAALAQLIQDTTGNLVAERFEVYFRGIELANGYHELADGKEQRSRFIKANQQRIEAGKEELPIDEHFLTALDNLPDCCGVAVGFDRLMLLRHKAQSLDEILPFSWNRV